MKCKLLQAATCGLLLFTCSGIALAQDEEGEGAAVVPVELYICNYNDGKGPSDLDAWSGKWNQWADSSGLPPYSAWTLTPFYFGADQDFDFIWLGVSPDGKTLGRAYDMYQSDSGSLPAEFAALATCQAHSNMATMRYKKPPESDAKSFLLTFSDCTVEEGKNWDDHVHPALTAWADYRSSHGSQAGMWVMWPAFGGGDADFDFKFVVSQPNHESLGADYDEYSSNGYLKARELFSGLLDCNEARVYNSAERRSGIPQEE